MVFAPAGDWSPEPVLALTLAFADRDITPLQRLDGLRFLAVQLGDIVDTGHLGAAVHETVVLC